MNTRYAFHLIAGMALLMGPISDLSAQSLPPDNLWYHYGNAAAAVPCVHDATCSDVGRPWAHAADAVVRYVWNPTHPTLFGCTGTLMNNTAEDLTPLILTAAHCADFSLNSDHTFFLQFGWQRDSADCNDELSPTPTSYEYVQITVRTIAFDPFGYGDVVLLRPRDEIDLAALDTLHVHYAGWSRLDSIPTMGGVLGHPRGDVMKIAYDDDAIDWSDTENWEGLADVGGISHGHSGSALFNQDRRVVGHIVNYASDCLLPDDPEKEPMIGPKLRYTWGLNSTQIGNFLDPLGGGTAETLNMIANYDLVVTGETFDGSDQDLGDGFYRTARSITAEDDTVAVGGDLTLLARETITITGDFLAEAGADLYVNTFEQPSSKRGGALSEGGPVEEPAPTAARPALSAYPNPSRGPTTFRFSIPEPAHVRLAVYDVLGREVARLMDGEHPAGDVRLTWRPAGQLAAGIYVYRLTVGEAAESRRLTVLD